MEYILVVLNGEFLHKENVLLMNFINKNRIKHLWYQMKSHIFWWNHWLFFFSFNWWQKIGVDSGQVEQSSISFTKWKSQTNISAFPFLVYPFNWIPIGIYSSFLLSKVENYAEATMEVKEKIADYKCSVAIFFLSLV